MGFETSARARLRTATAAAHARVDAAFSGYDLARRASYGQFLLAQAAALLPLERALDAGIAPDLGIDWPQRRRSEALRSDLAALSLAAPRDDGLPPIEDPAAALGTIYVLEGSRLGGAVLKRAVAPELPTAFLAPGEPGQWRRLTQALDAALRTEAQREGAVRAAAAAFALFERGARALAAGEAA